VKQIEFSLLGLSHLSKLRYSLYFCTSELLVSDFDRLVKWEVHCAYVGSPEKFVSHIYYVVFNIQEAQQLLGVADRTAP